MRAKISRKGKTVTVEHLGGEVWEDKFTIDDIMINAAPYHNFLAAIPGMSSVGMLWLGKGKDSYMYNTTEDAKKAVVIIARAVLELNRRNTT